MKDNLHRGWISIYRSTFDHWLSPFNRRGRERKFTKFEAWIYILSEVNHAPKKVPYRSSIYECKRGESIKALSTWANEFNWSKSKVKRYFSQLIEVEMLEQIEHPILTHIRVCNYDSYQDNRNRDEPQSETTTKRPRTPNETPTKPNNKGNNLITINNSIYKEVLTSKIFFKEISKIHKKEVPEILQTFSSFYKLKYAENQKEFTPEDVKNHFENWLKVPARKKKKKTEEETPPNNRPD